MKLTEHDANSTSTPTTGVLAVLRAAFARRGSGASVARRGSVALAFSLTAFVLPLWVPGSAVASEPLPTPELADCLGVSHTSMELLGHIGWEGAYDRPRSATQWIFEYSSSEAGPWTPVPGASGTITEAEFEARKETFAATFTGLTPEVVYYTRLITSNAAGTTTTPVEAQRIIPEVANYQCEALPFSPTAIDVDEILHVTAAAAEFKGTFKPHGEQVHWHFEYSTNDSTGFHEAPGASGTVLRGEENESGVSFVSGNLGGLSPGTTYYVRLFTEVEPEPGVHKSAVSQVKSFETFGPPIATTYAVHSVSGEDMVALGAVDPHGLDSHYRFEYVSQQHFEAQGFAGAATTPEADAGSGNGYVGVGGDLPGLQPGVTYRYRLFASNETAPRGVHSGEQTLTVPALPEVSATEACPNEALRIGPSAALPDCRVYEQVTPAEKKGAMDTDTPTGVTDEFRVAEDGEHFMLHAPGTQWGSSPGATQSNYFFSRIPGGWQMISATPQPQAGIDYYVPIVFNPDLTETGVEVGWLNSPVSSSPTVELQVGPPGGPYTTIASIPRKYVSTSHPLFYATSPDMGKAIIATEDRGLVPGEVSATKSGNDLYEYSKGQLRQVNVLSGHPGAPIGTCGAGTVKGIEGLAIPPSGGGGQTSSAHSVSADGSRVFFYAVPGSQCPEEASQLTYGGPNVHLYERVNGVETLDVGEYKFLAGNARGSSLLLEHVNGGEHEAFLYDTETRAAEPLFTVPTRFFAKISADFSTIYIVTLAGMTPEGQAGTGGGESMYRYDVSSKTLHYIPLHFSEIVNVSANGRYLVFEAISGGFPGIPGGQLKGEQGNQIYRYDSSENVIECVSCSSPFDPEPKFVSSALFGIHGWDGTPDQWFASENGDFVFFETPDALVPQDTNGEIAPSSGPGSEPEEFFRSKSSDVYEWRRDGVDGCAVMEGCLALISGGRGGGYLTELVGTTPSGRDVFFATHESLVPQDTDTAGDVYDARIGGGFPPPPPGPVECEGDACAAPFAAPSDLTPASVSFQGAGDVMAGAPKSGKTLKATRKPKKKKRAVKRRRKGAGAKRSARRRRAGK